MPARDPLSDTQIDAALPDGWRRQSGDGESLIERDFEFADFREAFAFLTRVAFVAEAMDHHPEIANVFNHVSLALSTHDAGNRVTETDLAFASHVNELTGA